MSLRVTVTGKFRKNNAQGQPGFLVQANTPDQKDPNTPEPIADFAFWVPEADGDDYEIDDVFGLEERKRATKKARG